MIITKTLNERNAQPKEVTTEQAKDYLEGRGYYKQGTVDQVLSCACKTTLRTPWAFYNFEPCK